MVTMFVAAACFFSVALWGRTGWASTSPPTVDVSYAIYQGLYNDTYNLNIWKG